MTFCFSVMIRIYAFPKNPPSYAENGCRMACRMALQRFSFTLQVPYYRPPSTLQVAFFALQVHSGITLAGTFVMMRSSRSLDWTSIPLPSPKHTDTEVKHLKSLSSTKPHMTCGRLYFRQFLTIATFIVSIAHLTTPVL